MFKLFECSPNNIVKLVGGSCCILTGNYKRMVINVRAYMPTLDLGDSRIYFVIQMLPTTNFIVVIQKTRGIMMRKNLVLAVLLSVVLLIAACGKEAESSSSPKEIIIGNIGAMSGTSAVNGKAQSQGIELAVKEINANGGILGAQVKIVTRDDEADPTKSKTFMEEIVDKEKAKFVIGPTNSTPAAASMAYLQENKVISMIPVATGTDLISKSNPYAFRIMPSNEIQAKALVKLAVEGNYKKIALVADTSALGVDGIAVMEKTLKEYGVEPAAKVTYKSDDPDMTPIAQKIKEANADVALFWTLGADGAKIVRSLERIDYIDNLQIIGYTGLAMPNFKRTGWPWG